MTTVSLAMKRFFFDREIVEKAIGRAAKKNISKAAAFVRTRAKGSLRRRKKPSKPGQPPSVHSTDSNATLRKILFAYNADTQSAVVGPVKLNGRTSYIVPQVLEKGGSPTVRQKRVGKSWVAAGRRVRPGQPTRTRSVRIEARPFMRPALEHEYPKFPGLWARSVN